MPSRPGFQVTSPHDVQRQRAYYGVRARIGRDGHATATVLDRADGFTQVQLHCAVVRQRVDECRGAISQL